MRSYIMFTVLAALIHVPNAQAKFEVHEWGTFTSLVGSNGKTQHGMFHEDEKLPDFVHPFGATQDAPVARATPQPTATPYDDCFKSCFNPRFFADNVITQKMETPVIYFYSDQTRDVEVNVKFPEGIITDTFPAPISTYPKFSDNPELKNGDTTFKVLIYGPPNDPKSLNLIPKVPFGNIYGHARNVQSNFVTSNLEYEKFIFYRGLGRFQPKIKITSYNGNVSLRPGNDGKIPQASFLVHVDEKGHGQMIYLTHFSSELAHSPSGATVRDFQLRRLRNHSTPLQDQTILSGASAKAALVKSLKTAGLVEDEAIAMVNTWESGYLKAPSLRLLYILPKGEADEILPLKVTPAPEKLERVFVGRIEIMLDTEEKELVEEFVRTKQINLAKLGRFSESMIHRLREVYLDRQFRRNEFPELLDLFDQYVDQSRKGSNAITTNLGNLQ